ncbi:semaphorin-5A-like [Clytia hemisphaerica]|uniref:Uncharacterized protein n=1 Tax=Clytia hemisphaerica TaxID=252671 RepID=A0A7M5WXZ7_9CNID
MEKLVAFLSLLSLVAASGSQLGPSQACDCRKVDGGLTEWTQFTPCSTSCGPGTKERVRFCAAPYPQYGGKDCSGALRECTQCEVKPCPVDGGWSSWKPGACSKTCGGGKRIELRSCTNPAPAHCGRRCQGLYTRTADCNTHKCPEFGPYKCGNCERDGSGACKKICRRQCFYQWKVVDNSMCSGQSAEVRPCDQSHCPTTTQATTTRAIYGFCQDCQARALEMAKTMTDPYQMANFVGLACRDNEVQANLRAICDDNKNKQTKNGGLPANGWWWIHCSVDGPWCKPCATRGLVFNSKCDACELTHDGPCTGPHSG